MRSVPRLSSFHLLTQIFACAVSFCTAVLTQAQAPGLNLGPDASFARLDFSQITLDQDTHRAHQSERDRSQRQEMINSGLVSALDLGAPDKAVAEFNRAAALLREQRSREAIIHLQKALAKYPKFVSAHINLGLAYLDQGDGEGARNEFEMAAQCDEKFSGAYLNLGLLSLSQRDFVTAQLQLEKAASLQPRSARILSALAYAQKEGHQYRRALETAQRVHTLEHKGMANVHYLAAGAAMALSDFETMRRELSIFLGEDPSNPFAPVARQNLEILARNAAIAMPGGSDSSPAVLPPEASGGPTPEERLARQLNELEDVSGAPKYQRRGSQPEPLLSDNRYTVPDSLLEKSWTIYKTVDEVALSFAVSSHGRMVSDLAPSDIQIRDNNKPPARVLQFASQSRLPMRLAVLIDTSGSVHDRFTFERHAAARFVQRLLNSASDLGFVAGFGSEIVVTQDFTGNPTQLATGIDKLTNGGGTVLFDAVSFACSKLEQYPDRERVARVLVLLSDGADTSSRNSLKQSIQDVETSGVTIYAVSTRDEAGPKKTEDKILQLFADRSGGEAIFPVDGSSLSKTFSKLHDLIRSRYLIAYKPADFVPDGRYRNVTITAQKNGKLLQVRARKGYYARLEPIH